MKIIKKIFYIFRNIILVPIYILSIGLMIIGMLGVALGEKYIR
jgi:hypothetical protein